MNHLVNTGLRRLFRAASGVAGLRGRNDIAGTLERPGSPHVYSRWVDIRGWAIATNGDPLVVKVKVNGRILKELALDEERPDVAPAATATKPSAPPAPAVRGFDAVVSLENLRLPRYALLTVTAVAPHRPVLTRVLGVRLLQQRRAGDRELPRHAYQETWDAVSRKLSDAQYSVAGTADTHVLDQSGESTANDVARETRITSADRVLEIGCGVGRVGVKLAARCREWVGADVSENMLRHAQQALASVNVTNASFVHLNGIDLSGIPDASFDVVYCTAVFMHLEEWDRFRYVCEAFRVLKPGGRVYVDNFCLTSPDGWKLFEQTAKLDPAARPPNISKSSTAEELNWYATNAGFQDVRVRPGALFVTVFAQKPS